MAYIKNFIHNYMMAGELSMEVRRINMIYLVGICASLLDLLAQVLFRQFNLPLVLVLAGIAGSIIILMYISNRFKIYKAATILLVFVLCDVLFPAAFFFLGGSGSGMPAFFVLSLIIIVLLMGGALRVVFLVLHVSIIIGCYFAGDRYPELVVSLSPAQRNIDNVQATLIAGFCIGAIIIFQNRIYNRERRKVEHAGRLLQAVNETAELLISSDIDEIGESIAKSMEMIGRRVDVDRIFVWQRHGASGKMLYALEFKWEDAGRAPGSAQMANMWHLYEEGFPEWEPILSSGQCVNGPVGKLSQTERERLDPCGVRSILVTPVFIQEEFWGFVSYDDCRRGGRVFSGEEESILRSSGLLIANAMARSEMTGKLVQAREDALTSAKAKSDFLANMSHEIRTPLNAVIGMTSIGETSKDIERKDYCFGKINDASTHLLGVINDILDMSKIDADKLELSPVNFNFEKMVKRAVGVAAFRVDERQQHFTVRIDKNIPPFIVGDDQRLAQVITNLLSNAVKFTPEKGSIHLDAGLEGEEGGICTIRIYVKDSGIGISEEQMARLFTSFQQADSSTSRTFGGTGLGLAISKSIVEMMGGEISIDSELGKGSTFGFTIRAGRGVDETHGNMLNPGVNWQNIRILAVDDAEDVRAYFKDIAGRLGFNCDVADGGGAALGMIRENGAYDLYFIDWKMPEMNGLELARRIREDCKEDSVITMISSSEWASIEKEANGIGVSKFLAKPLFASSVADLINECLGRAGIMAPSEMQEGEADDFSGFRVLLAEDVEINREIVLALLEPTRIAIDCAENGAEAAALFRSAPALYDLILMDVQMPEMDGYEATRTIRAIGAAEAKTIPIIAMTANVFKEDVEKCLAAGMNEHIGKPLNFEEVLGVLRRHLRKRI
ncbi:MAG: response regulator [Clostridiales Family XIII bacterium]|jgi:signal transduction histidine kinase/CheY-like chemotaxis protein|nr:response regulator [Clostridiales Family XIII bacterium]